MHWRHITKEYIILLHSHINRWETPKPILLTVELEQLNVWIILKTAKDIKLVGVAKTSQEKNTSKRLWEIRNTGRESPRNSTSKKYTEIWNVCYMEEGKSVQSCSSKWHLSKWLNSKLGFDFSETADTCNSLWLWKR